jgi:hypothetical protein
MRSLIEDVDSIYACDAGKALPGNIEAGIVEIEIYGIGIQEVVIVSTPGKFGGFLRWFICPACNRRVGKLYFPPGKYAFLCRHCHRLGYRQQLLREFRKTQYEKKIITKQEKRSKEGLGILKELIRMLKAKENLNEIVFK